MPVAGSFVGNSDAFEGMTVEILVTSNAARAGNRGFETASSVGGARREADRFRA